MAHNLARTRVDFAVERMDSVAEVRDESVEPLGQRVDAFSSARVDSFDCGLNFVDGGCREEDGVFMDLDPLSKAVLLWSSGGQALEQSGVN